MKQKHPQQKHPHQSYNNFGELTELSDNTFTYELTQRDNSGAITQKRETLNGITATYDYTFDTMGRLTNVTKDNQEVETYTYDNNGNRASATVHGTSISASYTLDDNLVVYGDNTYLYNEDGYLKTKTTPDGSTTYSYGTMGELLSVITPTQNITYQQNANNQRVAKLIDGQVVEKYLWANLTTLLAIYDKDDNLVQRFEYADQRMPVSITQGSTKYYLHYDQVGSLRAVSDSSHAMVKEIVYGTYGNIISDSNEAFKVPFGFAGGDSNLYGYVLGDPVNLFDPTVLKPPKDKPKDADKMSSSEFYKAVKSNGKWDYKRSNRKYENFGYTAAAFGIPRGIGKFGAGMYQLKSGTSSWGYYDSFFDDPQDQKWINEGYSDYTNSYYKCSESCIK